MKLTTKIIADKVIEVTNCDIRSISRNSEIVKARYIYAKLCDEFLDETLKNISQEIEKNHATLLHYLRQVNNEHVFKGELEYNYDLIKAYLFGEEVDISNKYLKEVRQQYNALLTKFGRISKKHIDLSEEYNLLKADYQRLLMKNLKLNSKNK